MVRTMFADTLKFLGLLAWIILAWAFFYWVLYRDKYGSWWDTELSLDDLEEECFDADVEFESLSRAILILWEATLLGDGHFYCFAQSSSPDFASAATRAMASNPTLAN